MKKAILSLLVIVALISCGPSDKKQTVKIENKYSLTIPAFLTKAKGLNEEASLQYQNGRKEFYVIVIDDDKEVLVKALEENGLSDTYSNDIKGYSELLLKGFENNINVSKKSEIKDTVINNMKARLINMNGKVDKIDAYYSVAYVEGKNRYYQVMVWTLGKFENDYKDQMNEIFYTLREL